MARRMIKLWVDDDEYRHFWALLHTDPRFKLVAHYAPDVFDITITVPNAASNAQPPLMQHIKNLRLPNRPANAILRSGLSYLYQITAYTEAEFSKIPNLGPTGLAAVTNCLDAAGAKFADAVIPRVPHLPKGVNLDSPLTALDGFTSDGLTMLKALDITCIKGTLWLRAAALPGPRAGEDDHSLVIWTTLARHNILLKLSGRNT